MCELGIGCLSVVFSISTYFQVNLLASGDSDGRIAIWHLSEAPSTAPAVDDLPPNKENWIRLRVRLRVFFVKRGTH